MTPEIGTQQTDSFPLPLTGSRGSGESRSQSLIKRMAWTSFAVFCLLVFTLFKLPEAKLKSYVQGTISSLLAPKGIGFTTESAKISFGLGISYVMKEVTLVLPPPANPVKIDEIRVTPSLTSLLLGAQGGSFSLQKGDGTLKGSFSTKASATAQEISLSFDAQAIDLGRVGLLPILAGVQGGLVVNGSGQVSGDLNNPTTLGGEINLQLGKIVLEAQSIQGFSIPKIALSEGKLEGTINQGKLAIRSFRLGKPGSPDDLIGQATGDLTLGRVPENTQLNLKTKFNLSQNVQSAFKLLDIILGQGKQPDGSYAFVITGPMYAPNFAPAGAAP